MRKNMRGWLACMVTVLVMILAGSAFARGEAMGLEAAASPVSPSLETNVLLKITSSLLGKEARLDLVPGSGNEWTVDGQKASLPWSFRVSESSLSVCLTDREGAGHLFEADHSIGEDTVIFLCRDLEEMEISAVRGTEGRWTVVFPFDLSLFDQAQIRVALSLDTEWDALPEGEVYRGIHPLYTAVWTVGEENWEFPLTESGFVSLPLPAEARLDAEGTDLTAGDAAFALEGEDGLLARAECDEDGRAVFSDLRLLPGMQNEARLTLSQLPETAGGLVPDETVYALYLSMTPWEQNGTAWQAVRRTELRTVSGREEETAGVLEEPFRFSFENDPVLEGAAGEEDRLLCAFADEYRASGECVIRGRVTIPTRYAAVWENEFTLSLLEDGQEIASTGTESGGRFAFPAIGYSQDDVGVHTYTVLQREGDVGGVRYDLSGHTVTVEVKDAGHGVLTAEASGEIAIENVYSASGSLDLPVTTVLSGREIRPGEFVYGLFEGNDLLGSAACDASGLAVIHVDYTIEDVREGQGTGHRSSQRAYTLRLINAGETAGGISADEGEIPVRVILTENGEGQVGASFIPDAASLVFNHTYTASGQIDVTGQLSLTQGALKDGQFIFQILEGDKLISSASNREDGRLVFPPIMYGVSDAGEHTYKVKQYLSASAGIFQDEKVYTLVADVSDNGDGTMKADYVVLDSEDGRIRFENGYQAHGSIELFFDIDLVGRAIGEEEFSFRLFEGQTLLQEVYADTEGHVQFERIRYTIRDVGTHTYVVRTGKLPQASVESDRSAFNIVVEVSDNGRGELSAIIRNRPESFAFVYTPFGSYTLDAYVSLKGRDLKDGEMTFYIMEGSRHVSSGTNDMAGRIVFDPMEYSRKDIGTHVYTVVQSDDVPGGVTRDGTVYTMTVYVTDLGNGQLATECDRLKNLSFACTYEAEGTFVPSVRVDLMDASMREGQFTFEMVEYGKIVKTQTNSQDGTVPFRPFAYTLSDAGQHEYTVRQVGTGTDGIELDKTLYRLTVLVTDNGDGTLRTEAQTDGITFANRYLTRGTLLLQAQTVLSGRALREGEFAFRILNGDSLLAEGTNDADGKVLFSPIVFENGDLRTEDGSLAEKKTLDLTAQIRPVGEGGGIQLENSEFPFKVHLRDRGDGTMEASSSVAPSDLVFRAAYEAAGEWQMKARVLLDGKAPAEGTFALGLYEQGRLIAEAGNDADGVFAFPAVTYGNEDIGVHTYTLAQTGVMKGITCESGPAAFSCRVSDAGNGVLEVTCDAEGEPLFQNRTVSEGGMELAAQVVLEGRPLRTGEFSFVLTEGDRTVGTGMNDAEGYVLFTPVTYGEADLGDHLYTIRADSVPAGVELSDETFETPVRVCRDGEENVCWYTDGTMIPVFGASYSAGTVFAPEAIVEVRGRALEEGRFTLALYSDGVLLDEKTADADGKVLFDGIAYTSRDAGEQVYTLVQTSGEQPGYTLDTVSRQIRVLVTDDLNGTLTAQQDGIPVFANTYQSSGSFTPDVRTAVSGRALQEGEFRFVLEEDGQQIGEGSCDANGQVHFAPVLYTGADEGMHTLTVRALNAGGDGLTLTGSGEAVLTVDARDAGDGTMVLSCADQALFQYEYAASGDLVLRVRAQVSGRPIREGEFRYELIRDGQILSSAVSDGEGMCEFEPVPYGSGDVGSREYLIRLEGELPSGVSGNTRASVTVEARDDGKGAIVFDLLPDPACVFAYVYAPTGSAAFAFRIVSALPMTGGEYLVTAEDESGRVYTAVNDADGSVCFNPIDYTLAEVGEHIYTVRQEKGDLGGVLYDETVYRIHVRVTEEESGVLHCEYDTANVEFVNGYRAEGEWVCRAKVILQGLDPSKGRITLSLTENGQVLSQAEMDGNGDAEFAPLHFTDGDAGEKEYRIYASSSAYSRLISDEEGTRASVTVTDNGDGTLTCVSSDVPEILLSYESAGHAAVEVKVELEGRALKADEFRFALYEGNDLKDTARADENGLAVLDVYYDTGSAGEHDYVIRQLEPGAKGVQWEDIALPVKAYAEDLGDGGMNVTVTYPEGGAVYHNTYSASGSAKIRASVVLSGKEMQAGQFTFVLLRDGAEIARAVNDAEGNVVFPETEITKAGGEILEYSVAQAAGEEPGIVYDTTVYPVLCRVTDDGEGCLTAEHAALPAFRNSYTAAGEALLNAQVDLVGRKLSEGSFTLTLSEKGTVLQEKTCDAEGTVTFDPVSYTLEDVGTHEYEVKESATAEAGVPLDPSAGVIQTRVLDRGDGTLEVTVTGNGPVFENSFTAKTELTVRVRVAGNVPDEELTERLILKDAENNPLEEIGARNGINSFRPLVFTQADAGKQFVYTVSCTGAETVYTVRASVSDGLNGSLNTVSEVTGPEGRVDGIQFVIEHTVSLSVSVRGAREKVGFTVELEQDGSRLLGEYPVDGAAETVISSGGTLTLEKDGTAVIRDLPAGTGYSVVCNAVPRYTVTDENAKGVLTGQGKCAFELDLATVSFTARGIWNDEEGNRRTEPIPPAQWTLLADGKETDIPFTYNGTEYIAADLTRGSVEGGEILYSALVEPKENASVTYVNTGAWKEETALLYNGGVAVLQDGATFRVRVRFAEGTDENGESLYSYRPVTGTLYREDGVTASVTMNPDENGWCVLTDIDREMTYYVVPSGVAGYTAAYRNAREYGNVTDRIYDGGTVTFAPGKEPVSRTQMLLYGGGAAALLGLGGFGAAALAKKRRKKQRSASMQEPGNEDF